MTTPVFSDTQGNMQFVIEPSKHQVLPCCPFHSFCELPTACLECPPGEDQCLWGCRL